MAISRNNSYEGRDPNAVPNFLSSGFVADFLGLSIDLLADVLRRLANLGLVQPSKVAGLLITDLGALEHNSQTRTEPLSRLPADRVSGRHRQEFVILNIHPMVQSKSRNDLAGIHPILQAQRKEEQLQFVVHELGQPHQEPAGRRAGPGQSDRAAKCDRGGVSDSVF